MPVCVNDPWEAEDGSWTLDGGIAQAANNRGRMVAPMKRLVLANDARETFSDVIVQKIISEEGGKKKAIKRTERIVVTTKAVPLGQRLLRDPVQPCARSQG